MTPSRGDLDEAMDPHRHAREKYSLKSLVGQLDKLAAFRSQEADSWGKPTHFLPSISRRKFHPGYSPLTLADAEITLCENFEIQHHQVLWSVGAHCDLQAASDSEGRHLTSAAASGLSI
jgi:hypothetical protein